MNIETFLKYPVVFVTGLILALHLTWVWGRLASRWGFVDQPGGRKIHKAPIPVAGGIAVFLGFHGACAMVFLFPWLPFDGQISIDWWFRFIPLSVGVLLLGLLDDRFVLKPWVKLVGQTLLAVAAYLLKIRIQNVLGVELPESVDFAVTVLWFVALMNAFNLIDGIDGLATGVALVAAIGIAVSLVFRKMPGDVLLFVGFGGACLGFLRYNFYPASVFLGDTGSLFIGFTLAAMTISSSAKGTAVAAIGMPLLAVGVPLFDTILAIWRRSVRRWLSDSTGAVVRIDGGDADHLHHRLLRLGRSHGQVAWLLYGATGFLALIGILASVFNNQALGILGVGFVIAVYTIFRHLAWIELQDTGEAVLKGIRIPERRNRTLLYYLAFDLGTLNLAWLISVVLLDLQDGVLGEPLKAMWIRAVPIDVVIPFVMLLLFRSYSRVWYLARVGEYVTTGMAVVIGAAIACALNLMKVQLDSEAWHTVLHYVVMSGIAVPAVVGVRAALRVIQDMMQWRAYNAEGDIQKRELALIWGAGYRTTLFLRQCTYDFDRSRHIHVVGIISEDDALRGHLVHGIRVLGNLQNLTAVARAKNIQSLYIVEAVDDAMRDRIIESLRAVNVRIIQWSIDEKVLYE